MCARSDGKGKPEGGSGVVRTPSDLLGIEEQQPRSQGIDERDSMGPTHPGKYRSISGGGGAISALINQRGSPMRYESAIESIQRTEKSQAKTQAEKEKEKLGRVLQKRDWRKDRDAVDAAMIKTNRILAALGVLGMFSAVAQNELIFRDEDPMSDVVNALKLLNSCLAIGSLLLLIRYYSLRILFERIVNHLRRGYTLHIYVPWREVFGRLFFWIEIFLNVAHLPPYFTYEIEMISLDNFAITRIETLVACFNTFRLYLVARVFTDNILARMPKRHTVSTYAAVDLGAGFAFKKLFNGWEGVSYVGLSWVMMLSVCGYWFRAAELTACQFASAVHPRCKSDEAVLWSMDGIHFFEKNNDLYMQNAMWAMLVTSSTVGYGDIIATTHFSRAIAGIVGLAGIVMASLLTAALSSVLQWTPQELSLHLILEREASRVELRDKAAFLLQLWWKSNRGRALSRKQRLADEFDVLLKFRQLKRATQIEVEDLTGDNMKIDQIALRTKYLEQAVEHVADKLWEPDALQQLTEQYMLAAKDRGIEITGPPSEAELRGMIETSPFATKVRKRVRQQLKKVNELDMFDSMKTKKKVHKVGVPDNVRMQLTRSNSLDYSAAAVKARVRANWRRDRRIVDETMMRMHMIAALLALMGTTCAALQNEFLLRAFDTKSTRMVVLKAGNTAFSLATCVAVYRIYSLSELLGRIQNHLQRGYPLETNVSVWAVGKQRFFWLEVLLCIAHLPPYVSFELNLSNLDNFILYKGEMILSLVNTLRLYLFWRVITDSILVQIPRRHTVANFASVHIGKAYAFKKMLNGWGAVQYILGFWTFAVVLLGYWFRICEITACKAPLPPSGSEMCSSRNAEIWTLYGTEFEKQNDIYLYSAIWCVFISTTTVGYGDIVPTTHLSRFVCVVAALVGIVSASLLTAALGNALTFTQAEMSADLVLQREKARYELLVKSADMIAFWWRRRKNKLSRRQRRKDVFQMKREFHATMMATQVEVEDCAGMSKKIEQISSRTKYVERALDAIADKLCEAEVKEELEDEKFERAKSKSRSLHGEGVGQIIHAVPTLVLAQQNSFVQASKARQAIRGDHAITHTMNAAQFRRQRRLSRGGDAFRQPTLPAASAHVPAEIPGHAIVVALAMGIIDRTYAMITALGIKARPIGDKHLRSASFPASATHSHAGEQ